MADSHSLRHTYITRLVESGASVKVAQELARHATPTLTIGRYAHARLHDLTAALDGLSATDGNREAAALQATGTDDIPPTYTPTSSSANERNPVQSSAANVDDDPTPLDTRKPLRGAEKRNAAQPGAATCVNAPGWTRTTDLRFRKQMLYPTELRALGPSRYRGGG